MFLWRRMIFLANILEQEHVPTGLFSFRLELMVKTPTGDLAPHELHAWCFTWVDNNRKKRLINRVWDSQNARSIIRRWVTFSGTDGEDEGSKIFLDLRMCVFDGLGNSFKFNEPYSKIRPLNEPITVHVTSKRYTNLANEYKKYLSHKRGVWRLGH